VVESVYSAVRTDALYKADYVSSVKGYTCGYVDHRAGVDLVQKGGKKSFSVIGIRTPERQTCSYSLHWWRCPG